MRKRLNLAMTAIAATGVVGAAVTIGALGGDDRGPGAGVTAAATPDDPSALDVLVLVPDSAHADKDRELITEAVGQWQSGIDSLAGEPDLGWLRDADIRVTAQPIGSVASYALHDPEVVIVAATPPGSDASPGVGTFELYDGDDALCDTVEDPFAFATWSQRTGFASHHSLPEGIYLERCGGAGGDVCFAVNASIDSSGSMDDVIGTFTLVSDEFGHCLTRSSDYTRP